MDTNTVLFAAVCYYLFTGIISTYALGKTRFIAALHLLMIMLCASLLLLGASTQTSNLVLSEQLQAVAVWLGAIHLLFFLVFTLGVWPQEKRLASDQGGGVKSSDAPPNDSPEETDPPET